MPSTQEQVTITESGFLSLLQITDSFFPNGGFAHSYGLETYVQEGLVNSGEALAEFLTSYLRESLAASDCLALSLAYKAAESKDLAAVLELDKILSAQKLARESREASIKTGNRTLRVLDGLSTDPCLLEFGKLVREGKAYGHHALVFALAARAFGLGQQEAGLAFV